MTAFVTAGSVPATNVIHLSVWQRMTQFVCRPWNCSTAHVLRSLDARESYAEGLPHTTHFLVRILSDTEEQEWDLLRNTAYIPVSKWLYRHRHRCNFLTIRYQTSRYLAPTQQTRGLGIKARLAR